MIDKNIFRVHHGTITTPARTYYMTWFMGRMGISCTNHYVSFTRMKPVDDVSIECDLVQASWDN